MVKNSKGIEVAQILQDKCIACQICIGECPVGAIELSPEGVAHVDAEVCIGCGKCQESCPVEAVQFERARKKELSREERGMPPVGIPGYDGVAVFIEVQDGKGVQVSWELMGKARELADKLSTRVMGFLLGEEGVGRIAQDAFAYGCDEVHLSEHPVLEGYRSAPYGHALTHLCETVKPEILLMGATYLGRDLAGIVATHLKTGLTADCTGLSIEDKTRLLLMTRPTFGGNIMATIYCEHRRPQMSTVRPMVMRLPERVPGREGRVVLHEWSPPPMDLPEIVELVGDALEGGPDIVQSAALVVAGRGACDPQAFHLLQELADVVGGTLACSRPVVEAGLMPYERQVGQTGKTVAPKLYIAVGVSGAIQHLVAIQGAEKIVAINPDPNAPIFKVANVGIVGDYARVIPEFINQLKHRMGA